MESYGIQDNHMKSKGTIGNHTESTGILQGILCNPMESKQILRNPREPYVIYNPI